MSEVFKTGIGREDWGNCLVCGKHQDRRYGVCFDCSDYVKTDSKYAWDVRNPQKRWRVSSQGKLLAED